MSDSNEYLNFSDAARELQVSEEELEKLVASGEIASVKDGDEFKFKPEALAQFKKSAKTEPTIILSDDEMDLLDGVEEINLDEFDIPEEEEVSVNLSGDDATSELDLEAEVVPAGGTDEAEESKKKNESQAAADDGDDDGLEDFDLSDLSLDDDDDLSDDDSATAIEEEMVELSAEAKEEDAGSDDDDFGDLTLEGDDDIDLLSLDDDDDAASGGEVGDDTVLSLDGLLDDDDVAATDSTTPVPGTDVDGLELDLDDDDDLTLEGSITDDTILDTDVLDLTDEDDDFQLEEGDDPASTLIRSGGPRTMQMQRAPSHALFTILLMVGTLLSMVPIAVLVSLFIFNGHDPINQSSATDWITDANFLRGAMESVGDSVYSLLSGS